MGAVLLIVGFGGGYVIGKSASAANNDRGMVMDMQSMMLSMTSGLQGKTGDEFDKEFLSEMIVHHQGAVAMAQMALQNAKHSEIKKLSADIISSQDGQIADMSRWLKTWYGVDASSTSLSHE